MIQDIYPNIFHNEFGNYELNDEDGLLIFDKEGRILISREGESIHFAKGLDAKTFDASPDSITYLFSIDEKKYFLLFNEPVQTEKGFDFVSLNELRDSIVGTETFVAFTAFHLWQWYTDNRFCGHCGGKTVFHDKERALRCTECGRVIYPRINPAVIVGVTNGDSILITRYRNGYAHNALVAGFTEIGETFEQTVAREVMEEAGIKVKNIRYYKSQPWGTAQDILADFFCEVDGSTEIRMDKNEMKYAEWVKREDIVLQPTDLSLTNEMMRLFRDGGAIPL